MEKRKELELSLRILLETIDELHSEYRYSFGDKYYYVHDQKGFERMFKRAKSEIKKINKLIGEE